MLCVVFPSTAPSMHLSVSRRSTAMLRSRYFFPRYHGLRCASLSFQHFFQVSRKTRSPLHRLSRGK